MFLAEINIFSNWCINLNLDFQNLSFDIFQISHQHNFINGRILRIFLIFLTLPFFWKENSLCFIAVLMCFQNFDCWAWTDFVDADKICENVLTNNFSKCEWWSLKIAIESFWCEFCVLLIRFLAATRSIYFWIKIVFCSKFSRAFLIFCIIRSIFSFIFAIFSQCFRFFHFVFAFF